jgi:hypothetical protein
LVAAQYGGYLVYTAIQEEKGARGSLSQKLAAEYRAKAEALRARYNTEWWNPAQSQYYPAMLPDRTYYGGYIDAIHAKALWFGITEEGLKTEAALDLLEKNRPHLPQVLSYFPDILFHFGRNDSAYRFLLEILDPEFAGRGMPEVVFVAVGAAATGLMGISPDAPRKMLETQSRLPKGLEWVKVSRLPILQNEVSIYHHGTAETTITNQAGPVFEWQTSFPAPTSSLKPRIVVDGRPVEATTVRQTNHQTLVSVRVPVKPGQTKTARLESN